MMRPVPVLLTVFLLLASLTLGFAQDDAVPFTLAAPDPVVNHNPDFNAWDGRYTDPGAVFYHDGQFHMFRNGFRSWPGSVQIGYLTSPDGITWTEMSPDPVLLTDQVPYAGVAALASSALVEPDGTWVIYFYTWRERSGLSGEIGRATASDPLGEWTVDPEPILTVGSAGAWDSAIVAAPSVVRDEAGGYRMYYSGGDANGWTGIGLATSSDGVHWTKFDDPVFASNTTDYAWHQPRVERTADGYIMLYRMAPLTTTLRGQMGLGIATSADGLVWENRTPEPVWERNSISGSNGFWFTASAYHDGRFYVYIEGGRGAYTDIYVATSNENFLD